MVSEGRVPGSVSRWYINIRNRLGGNNRTSINSVCRAIVSHQRHEDKHARRHSFSSCEEDLMTRKLQGARENKEVICRAIKQKNKIRSGKRNGDGDGKGLGTDR